MISYLNRTFVYPAYMKWHNYNRLDMLKKTEEQQWDSMNDVLERQFQSLKIMLNYAYEHVKYYKKVFDEYQVRPNDIKTPDDVKKIPVLTKSDIQNNLESLLSDACPASSRYQDASGGSTGQPTIIYLDRNGLDRKFAAMLMSDKRTGWQVGEKVVYLWGADHEVNKLKRMKEKILHRFVFRDETLNAFALTEDVMAAFAKRLISSKPSLIVAYTNVAFLFANYLRRNNLTGICPKGIICSAETLTEEKRKFIEETFQCKVFNRYGSREVGLIASECDRQEGLHINADDIYLEIGPFSKLYNESRDTGEIIVTDLINKVMPLIRYNMGDVGKLGKSVCSCGRGHPLIQEIAGRTSDFIIHPDGRLIHGELFSHAFYGIKEVRQFQIIQNKLDVLEVKVVLSGYLEKSMQDLIVDKIQDTVGDTVRVELSNVDHIPIPPSGKFRFVISNVNVSSVSNK